MGRSSLALFAAALLLAACQDEAWYRAAAVDEGWLIARADPEDQSCTILFIRERAPESWETRLSGIDVKFEGLDDAHVGYVREAAVDFNQCTTEELDGELLTSDASGRVRFKEVSFEGGRPVGCVIKLNAEVAGVRFKRKLEVWDERCPVPEGEIHEVDLRHAEFDDYSWDFPVLQVVGEVSETGACAYAVFNAGGANPDGFALPDGWGYSRAGVYLLEDGQECTQATVNEALGLPEHLHVNDRGDEGSGRVSFPTSEPYESYNQPLDRPCRASVDVTVKLPGQYPWVPRTLHFAGELAVEPSCGR
jgi:hypothetical protein